MLIKKMGMCPLLFGGFEGGGIVPLIAKKILDLLEAKNDPRSIIR
jgi:hypothetical protein